MMANFIWKEVTSEQMPAARSSHGLAVVGDTAYVFGGEYTARSPLPSTLHALDLSTPAACWKDVEVSSGEPPSPRFGHGQASMGDSIYIFGGRAGTQIDEQLMNDLHEFNTKTRKWEAVETSGDRPCPRSFHRMVSLGDKLYMFGGCPAKGRLADLYCLDISHKVWTRLPDSGMEGRGGAGFAAAGDKLVVLGGFAGREMADVWQFCPTSKKWNMLDVSLEPACSVALCLGLGSSVLLFGGELEPSDRGHEGAGDFSSDTCLFDADMKVAKLEAGRARPPARGWSAGAVWGGRRAVVVGGLTGSDESPVRMMDIWVGEIEN